MLNRREPILFRGYYVATIIGSNGTEYWKRSTEIERDYYGVHIKNPHMYNRNHSARIGIFSEGNEGHKGSIRKYGPAGIQHIGYEIYYSK